MMQEDEGATIRIEELEHKLRLAEQMAGHIYGKYKNLPNRTSLRESEDGKHVL